MRLKKTNPNRGYAYAQQKEYHKNIVGQGRVYLNELGLVREAPVAMG